ncbi:aliphatic sulfonate ABC transporter permease SsuC [Trinickia caryophylli]|uniref:Sulfonate transport system permease protein n=1 Tax=Trinickia caryophylli TaxID=28094 RepID=A0A1X7ET73_TRICW|nr:aliphatic sulfonate ABC transporter permease SsuC [Trinickia caryophylli]PMS12091.1 aliphatic sulfonate ABC transporter permease SsuC [Trinickia caryophylli]TRX18603.1 aliphatic sulfonate ABC transporter permease SsuC [Trinickia caryophylli]WQE10604.1 aliphatic sulfonate ABC transporter permease SsuC [Trinickia caryophylli]SMF39211.1 sulfonate transport system permease protein [Trinickia caryophylli]GLU32968.1 sulfonate ABC transporter [Trinickia caryophylli]
MTLRGLLMKRVVPWIVPVSMLLAWEASARAGWLSARILPEPLAVAQAAWALMRDGQMWVDVKMSTGRALAGFAAGGGIGFALGLATGLFRPVEAALDSTVQMIRNIPALAMIPLVILWFGIDEEAKLFLVALGVFFPVYINTFHGIRSVDANLVEMAKSYGLRGVALYRHVILPGALPSILVGVRFALGFMWVMLIVAETISAQSGIGYMTMNAREFMQTDVVVVGILLYALLGKFADLFARWLEWWLLPWHCAHAREVRRAGGGRLARLLRRAGGRPRTRLGLTGAKA